jgi:hypothetical protein
MAGHEPVRSPRFRPATDAAPRSIHFDRCTRYPRDIVRPNTITSLTCQLSSTHLSFSRFSLTPETLNPQLHIRADLAAFAHKPYLTKCATFCILRAGVFRKSHCFLIVILPNVRYFLISIERKNRTERKNRPRHFFGTCTNSVLRKHCTQLGHHSQRNRRTIRRDQTRNRRQRRKHRLSESQRLPIPSQRNPATART